MFSKAALLSLLSCHSSAFVLPTTFSPAPRASRARASSQGADVFTTGFDNAAGIKVDSSGPLEKIVLSTPGGALAEVYPYGACVTKFEVDGYDCLFVRPDAKLDGSKPISGGLPHCFPQFGPGEMQQHGFARNLVWNVHSTRPGSSPSVTLVLEDNEVTRGMWPYSFKAEYTVTLSSGRLATFLKVVNTGDEEFAFHAALHSYFRCTDVSQAVIKAGGFLFAEYLDKLEQPPAVKTFSASEVTVSKEVDSVFYGVSGELSLLDGATPRRLRILNGGGWTDTVLWNPYGNTAMGADNFVCIESAKVQERVKLPAGAEWVGKMDLVPTSS